MELIMQGLPESVVVQIYLNHLDAIERLDGKGIQSYVYIVNVLKQYYPDIIKGRLCHIEDTHKCLVVGIEEQIEENQGGVCFAETS